MQPSQRIAAVLIYPFIAWLGVACERTDTPMEARPTALVASSAPLLVDDDHLQCPTATYTSIQAAVTAAAPGDHIDVCPGTYVEQVVIPAGKDNIRLRSTRRWGAIIKAPAVMAPVNGKFTILRIAGAQNVTILAFTITGPGTAAFPGNCGTLHYGVRVDNGGSADILGNHITDIRDQYDPITGELSGCQNGMGVVVGGHFNDGVFSTGSAKIQGNLVDNYQKNGVVVGGSGSRAVIAANRVFGFGPSATIAQNGIEVISDAAAEVKHNFSSGHIFTPQFATPTGVLLYLAGSVDINHNTVARNDVDMYAFASSAPGSLTHNRTRSSTFDGILVDATNDATVGENHSEQNGGPGIGLYGGAMGNALENNQIERNNPTCPIACFGGGILLYDASNNTLRGNHMRNNGTLNGLDNTDGIRVNAPSTGNVIESNHLRGNLTHDCHDASTGNTWADNHGETSFGTAVCSDPDPQDDFAVAAGWDPSYPWYNSYDGLAPDYDWPSLYSTIDAQIESLLDLLPRLGSGGVRRSSP